MSTRQDRGVALVLLSGTLGFGAGMIVVVAVVAVATGGDPGLVSPAFGLLASGKWILVCALAGGGIAVLHMPRPAEPPVSGRIVVEIRPGVVPLAPAPIRRHSIRYEAAQDLTRAA